MLSIPIWVTWTAISFAGSLVVYVIIVNDVQRQRIKAYNEAVARGTWDE